MLTHTKICTSELKELPEADQSPPTVQKDAHFHNVNV